MTKREMTEIFAALRLAYPHSKMFEGGIETLKPTIELWTASLPDVDFAIGQRALCRVLRECRYPPTIAEFRAAAEEEEAEIKSLASKAIDSIRLQFMLHKTTRGLDADPVTQKAIDLLGGPEMLYIRGDTVDRWRWPEFEAAFRAAYLGIFNTPQFKNRGGNLLEEKRRTYSDHGRT